jgi:hypothetical protein
MTYNELYKKLQKNYTIAAQEYYKLPTDTQTSRNWQKALNDILYYLRRFKGKNIGKNEEVRE